jgi:predicted nucleic acid-binding protein
MSQFVFLGKNEFARDSLYASALETTLYLNKDREPATFSDVQALTKEGLWGVHLPIRVIQDTCSKLQQDDRIVIKTEMVSLSIKRRQQIDEEVRKSRWERKEVEDTFIRLVVAEYRRMTNSPLPGNDDRMCRQLFWKSIAKFIDLKINLIVQLFSSKNFDPSLELLDASLEGVKNEIKEQPLRESFGKSYVEMFKIGKFLSFLFKCSQIMTCVRIINVDPSAKILETKEFPNKRILLDTNSLMSLTCTNSAAHKSTTELVKLSQELGMKIGVTNRTMAEFRKVLDRANERMALLNVPHRVLKVVRDDFISSYAYDHDAREDLNWKSYYGDMSNLTILEKLNVEIADAPGISLLDKSAFDQVTEEVSRVWKKKYGEPKQLEVAEHDSFHLLLIKHLREEDKEEAILGPNYWFLTYDSTLGSVNKFINSLKKYKSELPSSIMESQWLDFITPFLNSDAREKEASEVFAGLIQSDQAAIPHGISPRILTEIQGEWMKYEWLSNDDVEKILKDSVMQQLGSKLSQFDDKDTAALPILSELRQQFDTLVSRTFDEKMKSLQTKMDTTEAAVRELNQKLSNRDTEVTGLKTKLDTENKFKMVWRAVSGGLGVLLVAAILYIFIANPEPSLNTTIIACIAIASGVILVLIAIAYEQVKAFVSVTLGSQKGL